MTDLARSIECAVELLGDAARVEVSLGERTTYRVGGSARVFVEAADIDELMTVGRVGAQCGLPVMTIGRGSNLLVAESGFDGIAVALGDGFTGISIERTGPEAPDIGEKTFVVAGGAVALPVLARRTVAEDLTGLEWMVGIPGSVGAAVCMNAGGHGSDVASSVVEADVVDLNDGSRSTWSTLDLGLRFRGSGIEPRHVVVSARFVLGRGERAAGEQTLREIVTWRRKNQPGGQNAGSVFVNPFEGHESAGRLIDEAGLKGRRLGTAEVSAKHGNFIQADPGGSADDVVALMRLVVEEVERHHGIRLRSEVRLVGFDAADLGSRPSGGNQ
ncbi:MAG: UDP-N-acetylmuramate dehydrogenase [Actinomycetia bacterium]|nr:UDP-N-acetylmuramate dehydrogenase [Actinomycetes bacterium]MCP4962627.1 UDP-N-acetylmuramate dehydrogenase [Actinomycetes bacterium]